MRPGMFGGGNFLKTDEVANGDKVTFENEGEEVLSKKFTYPKFTQKGEPHPFADKPKQEFHIQVKLVSGEIKTMRLNATTYNTLSGVWGADTADWVGKTAAIELSKLPNGNKMITLIPELNDWTK